MKAHAATLAWLSGILGSAILLSGALVAAIPYRGRGGEAYSLFNHYISEWGKSASPPCRLPSTPV